MPIETLILLNVSVRYFTVADRQAACESSLCSLCRSVRPLQSIWTLSDA